MSGFWDYGESDMQERMRRDRARLRTARTREDSRAVEEVPASATGANCPGRPAAAAREPLADPNWCKDPKGPNDRCDKCGTHISEWDEKPCVRSLTQSPRHTITRFHLADSNWCNR